MCLSCWTVLSTAVLLCLLGSAAPASYHSQQPTNQLNTQHPQSHPCSRTLLQTPASRLDSTAARVMRCVTFSVTGAGTVSKLYSELNGRWNRFKKFYPGSVYSKRSETKRYNSKKVLQIQAVLMVSIVSTKPTTAINKLIQLWKFDPRKSTVKSVIYKKGLTCNFYGNMPTAASMCASYILTVKKPTAQWTPVITHLKCTSANVRKQLDPPRLVSWMLVQVSNSTGYLQLTYTSATNDSLSSPCDKCVNMSPRTWIASFLAGSGPIRAVKRLACIAISDVLKGKPALDVTQWSEEQWTGKVSTVNGTVCSTAPAAAKKP